MSTWYDKIWYDIILKIRNIDILIRCDKIWYVLRATVKVIQFTLQYKVNYMEIIWKEGEDPWENTCAYACSVLLIGQLLGLPYLWESHQGLEDGAGLLFLAVLLKRAGIAGCKNKSDRHILKYMGGMQQYDIFFCFFVVIVHSCRNGWFGDTCVTTRVSELWEKVERNSIAMIDETISLLFLFSESCSEKKLQWIGHKKDLLLE